MRTGRRRLLVHSKQWLQKQLTFRNIWHMPNKRIEDFCINHLNTDIMMMPLYKRENRESERDRELPKATQCIRGGLR